MAYYPTRLKLFAKGASFALVIVILGQRPSAALERPVVRIGLIAPLSGVMAEAGSAFRDAAYMAAQEVPPESRFKYELVVEDDELRPAKVANAAHKLINIDRVDAIISTWSYGGIVVAPLAQRARVLHFGVAWDPAVARGEFNFIHLTPPRAFLPKFLEVFKRKGYKRIAAVGMIESGSLYCMDELERMLKADSLTLVDRVTVNYGEFDFRTIITRLEAQHPDVYFTNFGTAENDVFMKQAQEMRVKTPITSITGFDVSEDLTRLEGLWYVSDSIMPDEFAKRFAAKYGHRRLYGVGNFYDAVKLIVDRYESAAGLNKPKPESLLARFNHLDDFRSVFGKVRVDKEGIMSYEAQCRIIQNGTRQTVPCETISGTPGN